MVNEETWDVKDLIWKKLYIFASWDSNIEAKSGKQPHMMPTLISTILEHI